MKLNNESLKEFDTLLKECFEKAHSNAKSKRTPKDRILREIADNMRVEIDRTRTKFSRSMYHVDMAMRHKADSTSKRQIYHNWLMQQNPQRLTDDQLLRKFVQKNSSGYQVWDQQMHAWVTFSEDSEIHTQITRNPIDNDPIVALKAYNPTNGKRLEYTNNTAFYGTYVGPLLGDYGYSPQHRMQHKDSWYDSLAFGNGGVNATAGALQASFIGQSQFIESWGIKNKTFIEGKWQSKAGDWYRFKDIDLEANAFKQQSLKVSKHWAQQRSAGVNKYGNIAGKIGAVTFFISIYFSLNNIRAAKKTNDSNRNAVYVKNSVDIIMSAVAFIPYVGWAISGTYFLMDAEDAFGNYSPSGFTTTQAQAMHNRRQQLAREKLDDVIFEFEFDFEPTPEMKAYEMKEQQLKVRDHTYVAPRTLFKTDFK